MKVRWEGKIFEIPDEPARHKPTGPWYLHRSRIIKLGDEPPLNKEGFWKKPEQGMAVEEFTGDDEEADER